MSQENTHSKKKIQSNSRNLGLLAEAGQQRGWRQNHAYMSISNQFQIGIKKKSKEETEKG